MPPFDEDGMEASAWADAWQEGLNNDIIILGERYPLVKSGESSTKLVRNFVDDPELDFERARVGKGIMMPIVRDRKGKPATMEALAEKIQFVVLHADLTRHAKKTFDILLGRGLSTHFCINWDGIIYQFADVAQRTAHAAGVNDQSIGIDMNHRLVKENGDLAARKQFKDMRKRYLVMTKRVLQERGLTGRKLKEALERYEWERPETGKIQGSTQRVYGYTPRQYDSLILLLKLFVRELKMDKWFPMSVDGKVIPHMLEDGDLKKLRGFVAHYHLTDQRWDPGPAFNWQRVLSGLQNEYNWFPLAWKPELILQGKSVTQAAPAAYQLMRNTEKAEQGGTFPMGANQTWHGGVHLFPPQKGIKKKRHRVHAMFDGIVVAAHFEPGRRHLGHNNFVLLRHDVELPKRKGKVDEEGNREMEKLRFFSLYMHLDSMDVDQKGANALADKYERLTWPKRLYQLEALKEDKDELDKAVAGYEAELQAKREELQRRLDAGDPVDIQLAELILDIEDVGVTESEDKKAAEFLTVGYTSNALADPSKIAVLVAEEFELRVAAGEVLGFAGVVAGRDPEEDHLNGIHVEVFSSESTFYNIDLDTHAEHFRTPQRARGDDLTVRTEDILMIFRDSSRYRPYRKLQFWPNDKISPDEIRAFYARTARSDKRDVGELYREQLRRSITYHVSEWSDRVDWIASLTGGQPWDNETQREGFLKLVRRKGLFSREIRKFLPFIWLTKEVAEAVGLLEDKWDGRIYHYHPIHFVMWITFHAARRNRGFLTSLSLAKLIRRRRKNKRITALVSQGKRAQEKSPGAYDKFLRKLPRLMKKAPLRVAPSKKDPEKQAAYDDMYAKITNAIRGEFETEEDGKLHGVIENFDPLYANPKEVLQELFDLPDHNEWTIMGLESDA